MGLIGCAETSVHTINLYSRSWKSDGLIYTAVGDHCVYKRLQYVCVNFVGVYSASCIMGTGSFPEVKSGRGVTLTPHPLVVPWSLKSIDIPLLPPWAVRPVQSLSACTRVHFTLIFIYLVLEHVWEF